MKKTLTSLLLLITLLAFSQKGTYGLATINPKQTVKENPTKAKIYQNNNSCFSGIKYKVKNAGKFTGDDKSYSWWIMFTNTYDKPVAFSYRLVVGGVQYAGGSFGRTYTLKPGESYTNDWGSLKAMLFTSNSDKYEVEIKELCFGSDDCTKNGYAECGKTSNNAKSSVNSASQNIGNIATETSKLSYNEIKEKSANYFDSNEDQKAVDCLEILAKMGDLRAMCKVGLFYRGAFTKDGASRIATDFIKSKYWLEKAVSKNDYIAMLYLGQTYQLGRGVPIDFQKARELYEKAANSNKVPNANYQLGLLYQLGGGGLLKDLVKAKEYFKLACDEYSESGACAKLKELSDGNVATSNALQNSNYSATKKVKKVIPPFTFPFDKNKEPQDILEELITMLKNLGYNYERTTYDPNIKGLPMEVFFKEFKVSFSSKLPDYDYSTNKYGKRWVEKIWYNPLEGGSVYGKCDDCNELYNKINIEKN